MTKKHLIENVESKYLKLDLPNIRIGDNIKLGIEIKWLSENLPLN